MSNWQNVALSELGKVITGSTPSTSRNDFFGGDIPFVTPSDLDQAEEICETPRTLTVLGAENCRMLPKGAVLVCCIGSLGKVGLAGKTLATNQQINAVVFDEKKVFPLYGYFACKKLRPQLENMAPATTIAIVSKSKFQELEIPVPPLDEQRRIAEILYRNSMLIQRRSRAKMLMNSLMNAFFKEILQRSVHQIPYIPVGDLVSDTRIGLVRPASEFGVDFSYPYVRMDAIGRYGEFIEKKLLRTEASAKELKEFRLERGDLLFNTRNSRELVGKTALFPEVADTIFNNNIMRIRFNSSVLPEYAAAAFQSAYVRSELESRKSGTTSVCAIYWKELRTLPLPVPQLEVQKAFVKKYHIIEELIRRQNEQSEKMRQLFDMLQSRVFRGELAPTLVDDKHDLSLMS